MLQIAALFLLGFLFWKLISKRPKNYPPGPISIPILGNYVNLLFVEENKMSDRILQYGRKYKGIFSFNFGTYPGIIITDPKLAKEALCNKNFNGRPKLETILIPYKGLLRGIVCQEEQNWKLLRGFTFKHMSKLGLGKISMESILTIEGSHLVEDLRKEANLPISTWGKFSLPLLNIIWQIIGGKRMEQTDEEVKNVLDTIHRALEPSLASSVFFLPWVTQWFPKIVGWDHFLAMGNVTYDFISNFIERRLANPNSSEPNDFVGAFLAEIGKTSEESSCFFGETGKQNLIGSLVDLFVASMETCSTTLSWLFLYLALNPSKQEELRREITEVIGQNGVNLAHAMKMPYTEAVIMETMRLSSVIPMNLFHRALEDINIGGWDIPKGTLMSANIYAIHHDPGVWGDAQEFRPERFLSKDRKTIVHHPAYMPFSAGPRICPGITFSKEALFVFTVMILQSFSVTWDKSRDKPSTDAKLSIIRAPNPHRLIFNEI